MKFKITDLTDKNGEYREIDTGTVTIQILKRDKSINIEEKTIFSDVYNYIRLDEEEVKEIIKQYKEYLKKKEGDKND